LQTDPRLGENFDPQFRKFPVTHTPPDKTAQYILTHMKGGRITGFFIILFFPRFFMWLKKFAAHYCLVLLCHNIMRAILLQKLSGKVASILKRFID
jgi:hypothetical protein